MMLSSFAIAKVERVFFVCDLHQSLSEIFCIRRTESGRVELQRRHEIYDPTVAHLIVIAARSHSFINR